VTCPASDDVVDIIHEPENALAYNLIRTAEDVAVDVVTVSWLTTYRVLVREIGCAARVIDRIDPTRSFEDLRQRQSA
jgi:hypothetical protein